MLDVCLTLCGPLFWSTDLVGVELDKGLEPLIMWKSLLLVSRSESSFSKRS